MAMRNLRVDEDEILKKKSRDIEKIDDKILQLIDDMFDTMFDNYGVGLAAPQVGILKRLIVIDVGEGPVVLINPVIVSSSGTQTAIEGCLSVTKFMGIVKRPEEVIVRGFDESMRKVEYKAKDLFARAVCHEIDHLNGILFTDIAEEIINKEDLEGED